MTSLTCSSRQARTQRVHWMQASRFTAIAGCDRSACGCARARRSAACRRSSFVGPVVELGVERVGRLRHVGQQQLEHHLLAATARALSVVTSMPSVGIAAAGRRQHALALDLDHAGAAVAVGPHAVLVAEVRDLDAVRASAVSMIVSSARPSTVAAVQRELDRHVELRCMRCVHRRSCSTSCGKYFITQSAPDSARPGRGRRSTRRTIACDSSSSSGWSHVGCSHQRRAPWRCRRGTACTGRRTRRRRTSSGCAPRRVARVLVRQHHDRRRADEAAVRLQRVEVERDVGHATPAGCRPRRRRAGRRRTRGRRACRRSIRRSAR